MVPTGTAFFGISNQTAVSITFNSTNIGGWTFSAGASPYTFTIGQQLVFTGAGIVINGGSITMNNNSGVLPGDIQFTNSGTAGSAIINNSIGIIGFNNSSTAGSATINNSNFVSFYDNSTAGSATITNSAGSTAFQDSSTAGTATIIGGTQFLDSSTAGSATIIGSILFFNNSTGGNAAIINNNGTVDFSLSAGPNNDHKLTAGSIAGSGVFELGQDQLTVGGNNASTTVNGVIMDGGLARGTGGSLVKVGTGSMTLGGVNTYTGATTVNGGTLEVDGSTTSSSFTTINTNGRLSGTGVVGNTAVSGGTLAPGNSTNHTGTLTINGSLSFQTAAAYMIMIDGTNNSATTVLGAATVNGGVAVASGSSIVPNHTYVIINAGSLSGHFDTTVTYRGYQGTVSDVGNNVDVSFVLTPLASLLPSGAPQNGVNVANGIDAYVASGGPVPTGFKNLFNLSPQQLQTTLTELDGEDATDAEKGAFQFMSDFLNLMLDPASTGGGGGAGGGVTGFAPEQDATLPPEIASAYAAMLTKAPPKQTFDQRWMTWGSAFGGSSHTDGDPAVGSTNVNAGDFGFAGGMDYHLSPDSLVGFSLAGGGTNWSMAQNLGSGRSDTFAAGIYGKTHSGPAYLSAALAFANNWFTTDRTSALGDQLQAKFQGQSVGGRLEAGYRYGLPSTAYLAGLTAYAAVQAQSFHTPSYTETDLTAGGFGLAFNAMNATDTRGELGARFDDLTMLNNLPLILRARLAWAHDWISNPALDAVFQALPGSNFIVNGAAPPKDSALTTLGAELRMTANWSLLGKFDGEFGKGAQTYAGTGTLRYVW